MPHGQLGTPDHTGKSCASCGAPLPLRAAKPGESEARWICATCGGRYRGILDESATPEARAYVRRDDQPIV